MNTFRPNSQKFSLNSKNPAKLRHHLTYIWRKNFNSFDAGWNSHILLITTSKKLTKIVVIHEIIAYSDQTAKSIANKFSLANF